jgi:hypothetical protein
MQLFALRLGLIGRLIFTSVSSVLSLPYICPPFASRRSIANGRTAFHEGIENAYLCVHNTLAQTVELRVLGDNFLVGVWVFGCIFRPSLFTSNKSRPSLLVSWISMSVTRCLLGKTYSRSVGSEKGTRRMSLSSCSKNPSFQCSQESTCFKGRRSNKIDRAIIYRQSPAEH